MEKKLKEKDPESIVYIRSAAHSNYTGMVAMIGTDGKIYLGKKENYVFGSGKPAYYKNHDGSLRYITDRQDIYGFLHGEGWVLSQEEMLRNGLTVEQYVEFAKLRDGVLKQFEVQREIRFADQPFQPPDNYLHNAELSVEGQTGNYNMITGLIDDKISLEDERGESEKQSVVERLKAEHTEHKERQSAPSSPCKELS